MIRQPVVAGQFYPGVETELRKIVGSFINGQTTKKDVIGLVLPHAGYVYSGAVAGATISEANFRDTFVILGPNHTGMGRPFSIMSSGRWQTPLGEVWIDAELAEKILAGSEYLEEDTAAHRFY